jgi:predicted nucleotidyltransferase component of viral defense system
MNLFDELVTEALKNQPDLATLRMVVEKELLHHDILRILSQANLLRDLTFIGGTCLRACYGGVRLSEDLDFTGGKHFTRETLIQLSSVLIDNLHTKYRLPVEVSAPVKDINNVDTWKIKIQTRPEQKHLPSQRINIDICAVSSYEKQPMILINPYGVDMGTSALIIQAQSREEIYTDKLLAFALRPNRIKYRDLWDMIWLHQQGIKPNLELIPLKLNERKLNFSDFLMLFNERVNLLTQDQNMMLEWKKEMQRFLPLEKINTILEKENIWQFMIILLKDLNNRLDTFFQNYINKRQD